MDPTLRPRQAQTDVSDVLNCTNDYYRPYDRLYQTYPHKPLKARVTRRMSGQDIAQFAKLKRSGVLIPYTQWYQFEFESEMLSGVNDNTYVNSGTVVRSRANCPIGAGDQNGQLPISEDYLRTFLPLQYDYTVTRAAAGIYDRGWDALTFLAEATQIRSLFANALQVLTTLAKRGRIPIGWRKMSSAYLSYRYGWRPLISDIKSVSRILSDGNEKVSRHRGRGFDTSVSTITSSGHTAAFVCGARFKWDVRDEIQVKLRGSVIADISVPEIQLNPLQTGWELIPFSFVIDWFLNVGRTISALAVASRSVSYVASKGYLIQCKRSVKYSYYDKDLNWRSGTFEAEGQSVATLTKREPCRIPIIPRLDVRVDAPKVLDLIALIAQRLK